MHTLHNTIQQIRESYAAELARATTDADLERISHRFLGRKDGEITMLLRSLKDLSLADKQAHGPAIQQLKTDIETALVARKNEITTTGQATRSPALDVTAYRRTVPRGSLHPLTQVRERIQSIFYTLGYSIVSGPEIEDDWHNFEALNIPADHPARDLHDTFWLTQPGLLLRTHTSNAQIRELEKGILPLAICSPGRVFRHEATDATHDFVFTQCEGLVVDRNISIAHLLGAIEQFMRLLFERTTLKVRVRPSYYPFVEPGLDVDISCPFCTAGCSVCKQSRWIEVGGAGIVHPHVLRACSIDPAIWSGFAFGLGVERIAMLFYHINDVRLFKTARLAVLEQFAGIGRCE